MALPLTGFLAGPVFAKFLTFVMTAMIVRVILALGIGVVVYTGFDIAITELQTQVNTQIAALGTPFPQLQSIMTMAGLVDSVNITFSAMLGVISVKTFFGTIKKLSLIS